MPTSAEDVPVDAMNSTTCQLGRPPEVAAHENAPPVLSSLIASQAMNPVKLETHPVPPLEMDSGRGIGGGVSVQDFHSRISVQVSPRVSNITSNRDSHRTSNRDSHRNVAFDVADLRNRGKSQYVVQTRIPLQESHRKVFRWKWAHKLARVMPKEDGTASSMRRAAVNKFARSFKAPSTNRKSSITFRKVKTEDSTQRLEPKNFMEFYAQLSARDGEQPHAFVDRKVDESSFHEEVTRLRRRLYDMNRLLLMPNARLMQFWDVLMLCLLFYTATVTPYEVSDAATHAPKTPPHWH